MRKIVILITILGLTVFLFSCLSPPTAKKPYKPIKEIPNAIVLGSIEATVHSDKVAGYRSDNEQISETAYNELLKAAKKEYGNGVDIADITWTEVKLNMVKQSVYSARGKVIAINQNAGIADALTRAAKDAIKNIPSNSTIAIVYITAQDQTAANYIADELEYIWVSEGYTICARSQLDMIRQEQNLQLSGEVDDDSAISIGKFTGANVIVTGKIEGDNTLRRLRLRLLDTQTAQVIGAASEQL